MATLGGTSGTRNFNPSLGETTLYAFNLCGVRNTALTQEHMQTAQFAANIVLTDWAARPGVNLWEVVLVTVPLVQGTQTYSVSPNVVSILDGYVTQSNRSTTTDRYILPISRTEYASYPNKTQQGFPTTYWYDKLLSPSITFWPVPDGNEVSFSYYAVQSIQDANLANAQQLDIQSYFLKAFVYALAHELAVIWAPEKEQLLDQKAEKAYQTAAEQNVEDSNFYISPMMSGYWRI